MNRVLVTGACGFLGRHVASLFKARGWTVIGIGHGTLGEEQSDEVVLDEWIEADIDLDGLSRVAGHLSCIVHCAGGGSVGESILHPMQEFQRTVESTLQVLEFLRTKHPDARLIYPSSSAVYGDQPDIPLSETCELAPISPYGFYKRIVEELCESYAENFNISIAVVRFFSLYGSGLKKQLLWDACTKLCSGKEVVIFYGTGQETRDWLHVTDATELIYLLASSQLSGYTVVNGGSGCRTTVRRVLSILSEELGSSAKIRMGNESKEGDPKHYWADIVQSQQLGWVPRCGIKEGLREYIQWFTSYNQIC